MLLATVGDILTIRKHYQKTFKLNSDESTNDNSLSCFDTNKFKELLEEMGDEPVTGEMLLAAFEESLVEIGMSEGDNFHMDIDDPNGSGNTNVGYSGKGNYDSYNHYEPESTTDNRTNQPTGTVTVPKNKKKATDNMYNPTRQTSTGRKANLV